MSGLNPIANRVARITAGNDPQFLGRMPSGYAILANQQPPEVRGGCMLLPEPTADGGPAHLNELDADTRARFLLDLSILGDAVQAATGCERLNYLILCNQVPWLHGHVVPRFAGEDPELRLKDPFEAYDFGGAPKADATGPDADLHAEITRALRRRTI
jgi:diadenosine tetraphosphate (Ap4A) HIT family hydrolase